MIKREDAFDAVQYARNDEELLGCLKEPSNRRRRVSYHMGRLTCTVLAVLVADGTCRWNTLKRERERERESVCVCVCVRACVCVCVSGAP